MRVVAVVLLVLFGVSNTVCQTNEQDFIRIAGKISSNSGRLASVWPGFWSLDEPFLFMKHASIVQVYNMENPPDDFVEISSRNLEPSLDGKAYKKLTYLAEYQDEEHLYPGRYKIGDIEVYALEPKGSNDFNRIDFYIHESFHFYQRDKWAETPGDTVSITFHKPLLNSVQQVEKGYFPLLLNLERDLLSSILAEPSVNIWRKNLGELIVLRKMRGEVIPRKVSEVIDRYERREGSATYVGLANSTIANNYPTDTIHAQLQKHLKSPLEEFPAFPIKEQRFIRWPFYSIGGSYCVVLERLQIKNWKEELASGATISEILERVKRVSRTEERKIRKEIMEKIEDYSFDP